MPFLEKAEKLNPNDLQAAINLGKAYALSDRADLAADAYAFAQRAWPRTTEMPG
jgi:cytochrome c-type biogenesis protein CcmH/NrfG